MGIKGLGAAPLTAGTDGAMHCNEAAVAQHSLALHGG